MTIDEKLAPILAEVLQRNAGEDEFHQAVREVLESLGRVVAKNPDYADDALIERICDQAQDAWWNWNASVAYRADEERWQVSAFINNIGDSRPINGISSFSSARLYTANIAPPRTYGVRLLARY